MGDMNITPEHVQHARDLVAHMEAGNDAEVGRLLDELARMREANLFQELGKLTRELHEAMNSFRVDSRIADIAEKDIPDAKDRLNYVISMTEQAAHRTLDLVEQSLPVSERLGSHADKLRKDWERFQHRDMGATEFRALAHEISEFMTQVKDDAALMHGHLSEVLMAQGYQDLTGQIIRRVITLVREVEENLVGLIRISGQRMQKAPAAAAAAAPSGASVLEGPQVPGRESADVISGQDEVDDLLSSLGF